MSLSLEAVASKLLTIGPKTINIEGISTPNFHPSFRKAINIISCIYASSWATRTTVRFISISEYVSRQLHCFSIPYIGSHLGDVVYRVIPHRGVYCWSNQFKCVIAHSMFVLRLLRWWLVYHLLSPPSKFEKVTNRFEVSFWRLLGCSAAPVQEWLAPHFNTRLYYIFIKLSRYKVLKFPLTSPSQQREKRRCSFARDWAPILQVYFSKLWKLVSHCFLIYRFPSTN